MVLSVLKMHLNLVKNLQKTKMKIVIKDFFLKVMFNILKNYINFIIIYTFCLKIKGLSEIKGYVIHIKNLKQALNHGLVLTKVQRAIKSD